MSTTSSLLRVSLRVLRGNKRLILFPVLSITAEAIVLAAFAVPYLVFMHGSFAGPAHAGIAGYGLAALCYLALTAVSTYVNAALLIAVNQIMRGGQPDVGGALRSASGMLTSILAWSVVGSTVGLLIRALDRRVPIVSTILGISWSALAFFALPVMVFEGVGPIRGTQRVARGGHRHPAAGRNLYATTKTTPPQFAGVDLGRALA